MFNLNDFRVRDLDELIYHDYKKGELFDYTKEAKHNFFKFSISCYGSTYYFKDKNELVVYIRNALIDETALKFGGENPIPLEKANLENLFENLVMLDFHVEDSKKFKNRAEYFSTAHKLLSNIENITEGKDIEYEIKNFIDKDTYEKYLKKALKIYNKEQEATVDSQTPQPF